MGIQAAFAERHGFGLNNDDSVLRKLSGVPSIGSCAILDLYRTQVALHCFQRI